MTSRVDIRLLDLLTRLINEPFANYTRGLCITEISLVVGRMRSSGGR
jgi:hypothetical protein